MSKSVRALPLALAILMLFMFASFPIRAIADNSGSCGDNCWYSLSEDGTLTISGTGRIRDYQQAFSPFPIAATRVVVEDGITYVGRNAFYGMRIASVCLPGSVKELGDCAFRNCQSLAEISLPPDLKKIGEYCFEDCYKLKTVALPGALASMGKSAFSGAGLTNVAIPDSLLTIPNSAFLYCLYLERIDIPSTVTGIGDAAFQGCASLTAASIPASVSTIPRSAFRACKKLTALSIADGVNHIDPFAFADCESLESVTVPGSVVNIGDSAFYSCDSLSNVVLRDGVKYLGSKAFNGCGSLNRVTIPVSVREIGLDCFQNDTGLKDVYYGGTRSQWDSIAIFSGNDPLLSATLHPSEPTPPSEPTSIADAIVEVKDATYTGKALKPPVKVTLDGKALKEDVDYTVKYSNSTKIGTAAVSVTGKGSYTGTAKGTFNINPGKVTGLSLKANGKQQLAAAWKPVSGVSGYQIQYGLKKNFSDAAEVTVKKAKASSCALKGLKTKTTYYVRIRCYKRVKGKDYWSPWSATAKAKTK